MDTDNSSHPSHHRNPTDGILNNFYSSVMLLIFAGISGAVLVFFSYKLIASLRQKQRAKEDKKKLKQQRKEKEQQKKQKKK